MTRKFTMELVWHNCYLYPPKEERNNNLYVTDGGLKREHVDKAIEILSR